VSTALLSGIVAALAAALIGYLFGTLRAARRAEALRVELESTRAKLTSESEQRARTAELLSAAEAQVRAAVESASRAALNANSETFLKLAREVFGNDQVKANASLKEREEAIKQLVEPIRAALVKQEAQALELERLRMESHGKLAGQIEGLMNVQSILQRETRNLSTALRRPEVRGRWGELTLAPPGRAVGHGRALRLHRTAPGAGGREDVAARPHRAHAGVARDGRRREDSARRLHGRRGSERRRDPPRGASSATRNTSRRASASSA
jgi:hypothetical protein